MPRLLRFIIMKAADSPSMSGGRKRRRVVALRLLHLDHVGAHVGEHQAADRARHDVRELDHPHAGERPAGALSADSAAQRALPFGWAASARKRLQPFAEILRSCRHSLDQVARRRRPGPRRGAGAAPPWSRAWSAAHGRRACVGEFPARAHQRAWSSTTSETRPIARASSAPTRRAVKIISITRAGADQRRKPREFAIDRQLPSVRAIGKPNSRVRRRDAQVAGGGDAGAAARAGAGDRGDRRHRAGLDRGQHARRCAPRRPARPRPSRKSRNWVMSVPAAKARSPAPVTISALHRAVRGELAADLGEALVHGEGERVARLRPVQRDGGRSRRGLDQEFGRRRLPSPLLHARHRPSLTCRSNRRAPSAPAARR